MGGNRLFTYVFLVIGGLMMAGRAMALPMVNLVLVDGPSAMGDTFEVQVWADGDTIGLDLLAFGFDVSFDGGSMFEYLGYELASGFDDWSMGYGNVTADIFPGISADDVLLATLSFSTLALGTDTLNVLGIYDGMFTGLYYSLPGWELAGYDIDASLTITAEEVPVPEPASLILLTGGLLGCAGMNRKGQKARKVA